MPGCQWLYLRVTVGLLCAFFVLGVALVALLVTATASLKALNDNGETHVAALGNAASFRLSSFFAGPEDQVNALSNLTMSESLQFPSDHKSASMTEADRVAADVPRGGIELERVSNFVTSATFGTNMSLFGTTFWIGDGSRVIQFPIPQVKNALYIEKWWNDNVTGLLAHRETIMYDTATRRRIDSSDPRHAVVMPTREQVPLTGLRNPKTFAALSRLVHKGRGQPAKWSVPRFFHQAVPYRYVICVKELYNATHMYGFGISGVTFESIGRRLDDLQSLTPSSVAIVVGDGGFIYGSAGGRETFNVTPYSGGVVGPGCSSTDMTHNTIRSDQRLISCMHHMRDFDIPVVRKIDSTHGHILFDYDAQQFRCLDNSFVRIQRLSGVSVKAVVIVVVAERDVLGNVQHMILVTSLITVMSIVVAAVACFGLVWWLLWPLRGIAMRMAKAARLEEDPDPVAISPLVEIGDLQRAFVEMRDELDRIRAFVPQSLLRAADSPSDDMMDDATATVNSASIERTPIDAAGNSALRRGSSTNEQAACPRAGLESPPPSGGGGSGVLNSPPSQVTDAAVSGHGGIRIIDGMRRESVSVLSLNVCGFHRFFIDGGKDKEASIGKLVEVVLGAAQSERGVVESYHGDRFLVSFNAVKPAANHGTRATVAAMLVADAAETIGLAITSGVATGPARVGNMGTRAMMRFTIVGPCVAQANALERMCKLYTPVDYTDSSLSPFARCLVPQRLFQDLDTAVLRRTVDFVRLPQARNSCLIAEVEHVLRVAADNEWMYQLSSDDCNVSTNALRGSNAAWDACAAGDVETARRIQTALDAAAEANPSDLRVSRLSCCPRLRANCDALVPRDLGDFYNAFDTSSL